MTTATMKPAIQRRPVVRDVLFARLAVAEDGDAFRHLSTTRLMEAVGAGGVCVNTADPDAWYPPGQDMHRPASAELAVAAEHEAATLCTGCPVVAKCLELAIRYESGHDGGEPMPPFGIWGGHTPWQRRSLIVARLGQQQPAEVAAW